MSASLPHLAAPATVSGAASAAAPGAVPPRAPLRMLAQDLHNAPRRHFPRPGPRTLAARILTFGGALLLTVLGADQMMRVFDPARVSDLQQALGVLFTVTFGWIALSATGALSGLLFGPRAPGPRADPDAPLRSRTVLLMPVYNEDAVATAAALSAMGEGLARAGHGAAFEIFVLSDTRDADGWVRETTAFAALRERLAGRMAVWYRRRRHNTARKAGNLADFIRGWGGRYDLMLVLDADSLMAPETVVELVRRMEDDPRLGILQTTPMLAFGRTPYARIQQFASRVYGRAIATGVAAWQGDDGNYWGHNAMIRVAAFAKHGGLPDLRGRAPFGGSVLSHDFVEAALVRRGGWKVRMDPDLDRSWEGAPPSLADAAVRDRRWAQGNLQHLKVIGARGLRWPNRAHFAIGIGSYLASPLWLAMLIVGLALTVQTLLFRPEYFPRAYQLFPEWPRFDAVRMGWLFAAAMALLLAPKLIGLCRTLWDAGTRRAMGGGLQLVAGFCTEVVLSALYAPVMMLIQCVQVFEILSGRDSGWHAQARAGAAMRWRDALLRHWGHALTGLTVAATLSIVKPALLVWMAPVLLGLILAPLLARVSGSVTLGDALARAGLMTTPEERVTDPVLAEAARARAAIAPEVCDGLARLLHDPRAVQRHIATLDPTDEKPDEREWIAVVTARAKIGAAPTADAALGYLDTDERIAVLGTASLLLALARKGRSCRMAGV